MCIKERGAEPSANSGQATSTMFPPSLLYFAGGYVETSYGGQAGQAPSTVPSAALRASANSGQALSERKEACQKVRRRTRQHQPSNENNRYHTSVIRDAYCVYRIA